MPRSLPASDIFKPQALYDHLSVSDGGISEWIIPLIFAKHASTVWWVRPDWTEHIPDGVHEIYVGQITPTPAELLEEDGNDVGFNSSKAAEKRLRCFKSRFITFLGNHSTQHSVIKTHRNILECVQPCSTLLKILGVWHQSHAWIMGLLSRLW